MPILRAFSSVPVRLLLFVLQPIFLSKMLFRLVFLFLAEIFVVFEFFVFVCFRCSFLCGFYIGGLSNVLSGGGVRSPGKVSVLVDPPLRWTHLFRDGRGCWSTGIALPKGAWSSTLDLQKG